MNYTKKESIVELVELRKDEIYCDTGIIAQKFGIKHSKVTRAMETLIPKLGDFRGPAWSPTQSGLDPKFLTEKREYRGREYTAYLLNRDCFILLAMRFDTKRARQWQGRFVAAFNTMEERIIQSLENKQDKAWLVGRKLGKQARLEETDVIKDFVEYAMAQGSKSAKFYYKHITNATYKALDLISQKKPKLRDSMNMYELSELMLAERLARNSLRKYMELGRHYKDIYESVKEDLDLFGQSLSIGRDDTPVKYKKIA